MKYGYVEIECVKCHQMTPRCRQFFPWGPKKPLICSPCISYTFVDMMELIDFETTWKEVESELRI